MGEAPAELLTQLLSEHWGEGAASERGRSPEPLLPRLQEIHPHVPPVQGYKNTHLDGASDVTSDT